MKHYDVIVIGGGHAGCEAASASARLGVKTLLITIKLENLGEMSCNPAIGGVGKGIIVKEIDALGGLMAKVIDKASIHSKILNESKGPAVHGPRAQADRQLYKKAMQAILLEHPNLEIQFTSVEDLVIEDNRINGIITKQGEEIRSKAVVLTTGTFLNGLIRIGLTSTPAGRVGENPSIHLANTLKRLNFKLGRLKTGTPPRLDGKTIDWQSLQAQEGDKPPRPFSNLTKTITVPQINCYITHTNNKAHQIIRENSHLSPIFTGQIQSRGPRYCPSIEDKITRFSHKNQHQIFLEPEGLNDHTIYPNGISTSLPEEVQINFLQQIPGLEHVRIIRPGYAIEYDFIDPKQLWPSLETKIIKNLFFAGQINGTTGYEEAAGQGIIAGFNAALATNNSSPFVLDRSEAYIGVMIDDLITLGTSEPYRVFTSRAEYRLTLRADNCDLRLTEKAYKIGAISSEQKNILDLKNKAIIKARELLQNLTTTPYNASKFGINIAQDGTKRSAMTLLSYPNISLTKLSEIWPEINSITNPQIQEYITTEALYKNYIKRQEEDIKIFKTDENLSIPINVNYSKIQSLSLEVQEKLNLIKPKTIGAAARIPGITPAATMALIIYLKYQYEQGIMQTTNP